MARGVGRRPMITGGAVGAGAVALGDRLACQERQGIIAVIIEGSER
jgi:hypothetical protein